MSQWTVSEPEQITLNEPVRSVQVRIIGGAVNVVAAEGPSRLEVSELSGEPLQVSLEDGVLLVSYPNLSWSDFGPNLKSVDAVKDLFSSWKRKREDRVVVSLTVPADAKVQVGAVTAESTLTGLKGETTAYNVSGGTTLVGLAGRTEAGTVSGDVAAESVGGELRLKSVSGDLTVLAGTATTVRAGTVGGAVTLDLAGAAPADIKVNTVNGDVAVRLPRPADTTVEAGSTNGQFSTAFDELTVSGSWGAKKLSGTLGTGSGKLQVSTVSGAISVLGRPEPEDEGPSLVKELPAAAPSDAVPSDAEAGE
ncbi:DUF4097 family beta strand repeat-containing protein [Kitasatospora viridis]|uniref:Putative adhesin n=1 Tax=Kitasatospora viridis TaxID=281105 RepID=A0A561UF28_9ACTN|nr:DUF4097 family beta strand repeat-containing protein [Kitasatospora viridis]TWF97948.1 putative adhesin [Kitasatospora viridis]